MYTNKIILSNQIPFSETDFVEIMNLLVHEPNIVSPFILRAEILFDNNMAHTESVSSSSNNTVPNTESETNSNVNERIIERVLVPREKRNKKVWQRMVWKKEKSVKINQTITHHLITHTCFVDKEFNEIVTEWQDLPFYYPKCESYSFEFVEDRLGHGGRLSLLVSGRDLESLNELLGERMMSIWTKVFNQVMKMCIGSMNGYQKRVLHDVIIPKKSYQEKYQELKEKYAEWVEKWPETTDPRKHVFEDVAIATWLILLWDWEERSSALSLEERSSAKNSSGKKRKFVDIGCGNGFLTFILLREGYSGIGIDLSRRKLWDLFPDFVQDNLIERPIVPSREDFSGFEYLIGNHSDELTPWIPVLGLRDECKWIIIPCCLFELNGSKFAKKSPELGRYKTYCKYLIDFTTHELGYENLIEQENLRIPSTKNICIFTRSTQLPNMMDRKEFARKLIAETCFVTRKSDREKTMEYFQKKRDREAKHHQQEE